MLYVGLTDHLPRRLREHKDGVFDGFTKRYKINRLMCFEKMTDSYAARRREIQIKERKSRYLWARIRHGVIFRPKCLLGV
jgi:putative endonuclease